MEHFEGGQRLEVLARYTIIYINSIPSQNLKSQLGFLAPFGPFLSFQRSPKGGTNTFLRGDDWNHHFRTPSTHRNLVPAQKVNFGWGASVQIHENQPSSGFRARIQKPTSGWGSTDLPDVRPEEKTGGALGRVARLTYPNLT